DLIGSTPDGVSASQRATVRFADGWIRVVTQSSRRPVDVEMGRRGVAYSRKRRGHPCHQPLHRIARVGGSCERSSHATAGSNGLVFVAHSGAGPLLPTIVDRSNAREATPVF